MRRLRRRRLVARELGYPFAKESNPTHRRARSGRLHKTPRVEFLAAHDWRHGTIEALQAALDSWVLHCNTLRPHQSVGMRPPIKRFRLARSDEPEPDLLAEDDEPLADEEPPPGIARRIDQDGRIHQGGLAHGVGRWLTGEVVEIIVADGLVAISHRGILVATHAKRHQGKGHELRANEPRQRAARRPTIGPTVRRRVDSSGSVSFAGFHYRVGNSYVRSLVEVAIVSNTIEFSLQGQVVKRQPIRHDRSRGFGAFSWMLGRPRTHYCA